MISPNGFDNLQFFMGIVEDNRDPTNQGRVRVRCFGIHPPWDSGEVPTDDLPWAVPINGSYAGMSQIPRVADWVFGFFVDGRDAQHPMLIGTVPGQNLQQMAGSGVPNASGYIKPSEEAYQKHSHQPLHPAQSGEGLEDTQVVLQNASIRNVETAKEAFDVEASRDERGWEEPPTTISGEPQKTAIWASRYGESYIEVNGSDQNESINISHTSGSQVQIDHHGNVKIKSFGDMYNISEGHTREFTGGRRDVTIEGKWTVNVTDGDATLEVAGNLNHVVHGDYNLNVAGRMAVSVGLGYELVAARATMETVAEHFNIISAEKFKLRAEDTVSIHSGAEMYIDSDASIDMISEGYSRYHARGAHHVTADQSLYNTSFGSNHYTTAAGIIAEDAPLIYMNSGRANAGTAAVDTPETPASPQVDLPTNSKIVSSGNQGGVVTENRVTGAPSGGGIGTHSVDDSKPSALTEVDVNEVLSSEETAQARSAVEDFLGTAISDEEWNNLVAATVAESLPNSPEEQAAVMAVILNRVKSPLYPNTITGVLQQRNQFQAVTGTSANPGPSANFTNPDKNQIASTIRGVNAHLDTMPKDWLNFTSNITAAYGAGTNINFRDQVASAEGSRVIGGTVFGTVR